ncbi:sensor histidine kinase [Dyadobacter sp. CY312]|uniref:sensor histidine kinase n=1 Tax=Dyadobacter sp. CY312 TaxID=2907303 RepID=UPI001F47F328|nr:ATP-binding protein [Dyadobacter sp. CY312]MCE7044112.1 ATP-binding protein [Dyadobacter sp. CY312]
MQEYCSVSTFRDETCRPGFINGKQAILFLIGFLLWGIDGFGQKNTPAREWESLLSDYVSKSVHDTVYLRKVEVLAGQSLKEPQLKQRLATFRKIAWSKESYHPYRASYYGILANHSIAIHQEGFSIYYLQKQEEELKKSVGYVNSLSEPRLLLAIYGRDEQSNIDKRLGIFQDNLPFLKSLPGLLKKQQVHYLTCFNAMTILNHAAQIYAKKEDSLKVLAICNLSEGIFREIEKDAGFNKIRRQQCRLLLYMTEHARAKVLKDTRQQWTVLHDAETFVRAMQTESPSAWLRAFERAVLTKMIDFNIKQNQTDSSRYYFNILKKQVASDSKNSFGDGATKYLLYSSILSAKENNYRSAYDTLLKAYEINDSIIATKTADIHNNMYANMVAEQRTEQLVTAEIEKGNRNIVIFVISTLLIIAVASFILRQKARDAKMKRQIEYLNNTTQIQIAELEAKANTVQKKLGMELHDGISGNLVHICNHLATELMGEVDPEKRDRLQQLSDLAKKTYIATREKSHEWYTQGTEDELDAFSKSVEKIVSNALAGDNYEKQIEVDHLSLEKVSPLTRVHLLRIIQEAMANIIKHARASKIKLFIYEEDHSLTLQITDDGRGFDTNPKTNTKGVGLQSIRNRIQEMNGSLDIVTSPKGTELLCIIPI